MTTAPAVTTPRERPILFSGPMIRAILDGRKTMTRRILGGIDDTLTSVGELRGQTHAFFEHGDVRGRFGVPGDRLWVRETWASADRMYQDHENDVPGVIAYRADRSAIQYNTGSGKPRRIPDYDRATWNWDAIKWRSPIHMPRWASRITLEVTSVRVERVQEITEADARAEGAFHTEYPPHVHELSADGGKTWGTLKTASAGWSTHETTSSAQCLGSARMAFANLWIKINGAESWDANPFVWVVAFRRLQP